MIDEAKAREFYVEFLGFSIDWEHRFDDNAPLYLQISRGGCTLHLSEHYGDAVPGSALRIDTEDVDALNRELLGKNYKYAKPGVQETPWQTREMTLKDPFGNRLVFSQPLPPPAVDWRPSLSGVGETSRWVAASRALETGRADALYHDRFARELAGDVGLAILNAMRKAIGATTSGEPDPFLSIRTRFFDDTLLRATHGSAIRQVVVLAAGMDARAFRLDWPAGLVLFEVDRLEIFDYKEPVLVRLGAAPTCDRRVVVADLAEAWTEALLAAGFDPSRRAAFLAEGLFMYLEESAVTRLLAALRGLACEGSSLGLDGVNTEMLVSTQTARYMKMLEDAACPWKFGMDDPERLLAAHGWHATVVLPGEPDANYGRWPYPVVPRTTPHTPRGFYVHATRTGGLKPNGR
jgi:methyltransferase (TIGR00027 family)